MDTRVSSGSQLKLTDREFALLADSREALDRGRAYLLYHQMTGVEEALVQGKISTFSGVLGGTAYAANALLQIANQPHGGYLGIYRISQLVAISGMSAVDVDRRGTGTGKLSNSDLFLSARAAWQAIGQVNQFPGNLITWADHAVGQVQSSAQSNVLLSTSATLTALLEALSRLTALGRLTPERLFDELDAVGAKASFIALFGAGLFGKRNSDFLLSSTHRFIGTPDGNLSVVLNSHGKVDAILDRAPLVYDFQYLEQAASLAALPAQLFATFLPFLDSAMSWYRRQLTEQSAPFNGELRPHATNPAAGQSAWSFSASGTSGKDLLFGQWGLVPYLNRDLMDAGADDDVAFAGTGADTVRGGDGDDILYGQAGDDLLKGDGGADTLRGGAGDDRLEGGEGDDVLDGGDLTVEATDGNDTLVGGAGNDLLVGGDGHNVLLGGLGMDTYVVRSGGSNNIVRDDDGAGFVYVDGVQATVGLSLGHGTFVSADRALTFSVSGSLVTGATLTINDALRIEGFKNGDLGILLGTAQANLQELRPTTSTIALTNVPGSFGRMGTAGNDFAYTVTLTDKSFNGGWGNDLFMDLADVGASVDGAVGDDVIQGGAGTNGMFPWPAGYWLNGGPGSDLVIAGAMGSIISGDDREIQIQRSQSSGYLLWNGSLAYEGTLGPAGFGTLRHGNVFSSPVTFTAAIAYWRGDQDPSSWHDVLVGGVGADTIHDGSGSDRLYGGAGADVLNVGALTSVSGYSLLSMDERAIVEGFVASMSVDGDDFADGGDGNDTIGATLRADSADTLLGGAGDDWITIWSELEDSEFASVFVDGGAGNDFLYLGGSPEVDARGGDGDDHLILNASSIGRMDGGNGSDQYVVYGYTDAFASKMQIIESGTDVLDQDVLVIASNSVPGSVDVDAVRFIRRAQDLVVEVDGRSGHVSLQGWFGQEARVDEVRFVNNWYPGYSNSHRVWTASQIQDLAVLPGSTPGNDLLQAFEAGQTLSGAEGNDVLVASALGSTLVGGAGDDTLLSGSGLDTLEFEFGAGRDVVSGLASSAAIDILRFGADVTEADVSLELAADGLSVALTGTSDSLVLAGFDPLEAVEKPLLGSIYLAGVGIDWAAFLARGISVSGTEGNDSLLGTSIHDRFRGGTGDDTYVVNGLDEVTESDVDGGGDDLVRASVSYALSDNVERLELVGSASISGTGNISGNALIGNAGANRLDGLAGGDTMAGGAGNDTFVVDSAGDVVLENSGEGIDEIELGYLNPYWEISSWYQPYTMASGVERLRVLPSVQGFVAVTGNALDNRIEGGNFSAASEYTRHTLGGGAGNDTLLGGAGRDLLEGGEGDDSLSGGVGSDTLRGEAGSDTYVVDFALASGVDRIEDSDTGVWAGSGLNDRLQILGAPLSDLVFQAINTFDLQISRLGVAASNRSVVVENWFQFNRDGQRDSIEQIVVGSETLDLAGVLSRIQRPPASPVDDRLVGSSGADSLDGGNGNDTLHGMEGNDVLVSGAGVNRLFGGPGNDSLDASANAAGGYMGGAYLDGGIGADTMRGGLGSDTYVVNDPGDVVIEMANGGSNDLLEIWTPTYELSANVESAVQNVSVPGASWVIGNAGANYFHVQGGALIQAGGGDDTISGASMIAQGGAGRDTLSGSRQSLLDGGSGGDVLDDSSYDPVASRASLFIGGADQDTLLGGMWSWDMENEMYWEDSGSDVIVFKEGDGVDSLILTPTGNQTLSISGFRLDEIRLERVGNKSVNYPYGSFTTFGDLELQLGTSASDRITLQFSGSDWGHESLARLQVFIEDEEYSGSGSDPLRNERVQWFDFRGIADRVGSTVGSVLSGQQMAQALLDFHTGGSEDSAFGGDIAAYYHCTGSLQGMGRTFAHKVLDPSGLGVAAQPLRQISDLQTGGLA